MSTIVENASSGNQSKVSQRFEIVGQLASGLAHEINTPIQFIGDNVRFISSELGQLLLLFEEYRKLKELVSDHPDCQLQLQKIKAREQECELDFLIDDIPCALDQTIGGIDSISQIVQSLKALVHPGGRERVATDVNASIQQSATVSRGEWRVCAELDLNLEPELPFVSCYPGELIQVLVNLIVNAAHAVDEAHPNALGHIKICSFQYRDCVGITVEDTGGGIPIEIQHRVFDPFFTSKQVGKGTGQGLAFAHASIVERSKGTLYFESEEGQGTTFHIYLPIDEASL